MDEFIRNIRPDGPTAILPTDQFDKTLARLTGLPNGAHTKPVVVQAQDFYGNVTQFIVQTVRTDEGDTTFVTQANASGLTRYILPPNVLAVVDRQREANTTKVRRRHGQRLAEDRKASGTMPTFTPEMRAKALATRKAKARKRAKR